MSFLTPLLFDGIAIRLLRCHNLSEFSAGRLRVTVHQALPHKGDAAIFLECPEEWAALISRSRKGYWWLALSPQIKKALGLACWRTRASSV